MFRATKAELAAKAAELNFVRDTLEKVFRLADVLDYLNSNPITKSTLALKGGTAINLTVFNLPRLSVDIDLDYCADETREEMLKFREEISRDIKRYMETQDYILSPRSKEKHSLDSFVFFYKNLGGVKDNIKVEINYSLRSHIFEPINRKVTTTAFDKDLCVLSLMPMEIFAAKINALLSRAAARDLYDTYNMINFGLFDDSEMDILRRCVVLYTAISQEEILDEYDLDKIDFITIRKLRTDLLPVIKKGEFVELEHIKKIVKSFIRELLVLTEEEKEFLRLFKLKVYKPELIFNNVDILNRIREHPMIMWKLQAHD